MTATLAEHSERSELPHDPEKTARLVAHVRHPLAERIRAFQKRHEMVTLSEALRRLLTTGLEVEEQREREAKKPRK